ncbi:polymeric immunoglobulin receptor-like [Puntigrus tetrazona]|uniref:polymeric immunoglobulin receptor-like n=1 Tax=Puntigrus tetrazona TaxID=1606681 RepID=UPI001C891C84|nr:polymeric immunoglobulin receptor-like [Puntigrus tetrazona]
MAYTNMWIFLNILTSLHYLTKACTPSYSDSIQITAFSGGSVLLPCSCTDPQDKPKSVFWESNSKRASKDRIYTDIYSVFELYSGRITLFNQTSPGNVSLLLSDLTKDDQGSYVCLLDKTSRFYNVTIEERCVDTASSKPSLSSVWIFVLFIVISAGGAAAICSIRAHRKAKTESGEINGENNLDDSTYCTLQKKYDAEEMYGTIGNRSKQ